MARKNKNKVYNVDFNELESRNYKGLSKFGKEIIDKMIAMQEGEGSGLTPSQEAKLELVYAAMKELTPRQREVLERSFGVGKFKEDGPLSEHKVAEALGISQQAVHMLKMKAIEHIRNKVNVNDEAIKNIKKSEKK